MTSRTSTPGRFLGAREARGASGLHHDANPEVWTDSRDEGFLKVTAGPDGRLDASVIPGRPLRALRDGGFALATTSDSAAPGSLPTGADLHAVHVTRG